MHARGCIVVVLGRMDSSRLPGKLLRPLNGRCVIDAVLSRAIRISSATRCVLATTSRSIDDPLVAAAEEHGIAVFRGAADDVASRVVACATSADEAYVARVNGDSPFTDPELIDQGVGQAVASGCDLVSNLVPRSYPYGIAVEVLSVSALREALATMGEEDREHVTQFFYRHADRFDIQPFVPAGDGRTDRRLVVDTEDDLRRMQAVAQQLGERATIAGWREVTDTLDAIVLGPDSRPP